MSVMWVNVQFSSVMSKVSNVLLKLDVFYIRSILKCLTLSFSSLKIDVKNPLAVENPIFFSVLIPDHFSLTRDTKSKYCLSVATGQPHLHP